MHFKFSQYLFLSLVLIATCTDLYTQTLIGTTIDEQGLPLEAVSVFIPGLEMHTYTKIDGTFEFHDLPKGIYTLEFFRTGLEKTSKVIEVTDENLPLKIMLRSSPLELPVITVTAKPRVSDVGSTAQALSILEEKQIAMVRGQSFISTLDNVPGVAILQSGPFGGKPVIRGLSFQRIVIQENGLRHESQQWDEDDSPGIDAFNVQRIEVVRGPSSLLYGPNALGGVVNAVTTQPRPTNDSVPLLSGFFSLNGLSNNRQAAGNILMEGGSRNIRYNGSITMRHAGDISTPDGPINNSGARELNGDGSVVFKTTPANIAFIYSRFNQKKYLPTLSEEDNSPQSQAYQKTNHEQIQFRYLGKTYPTSLEILGNWQNNDASEFEDSDSQLPEIRLKLNTLDINTKLHHFLGGQTSGTIGLSFENQQNKTLGQDPLIPNYHQTNIAGVLYEEMNLQNVILSAGFRFDTRKIRIGKNEPLSITDQSRTFNAITGTAGVVWHAFLPFSFALNLGRGWRAPLTQELFVNGLEEGSVRYKIGNPDLKPEESIGIDISFRYNQPRLQTTFTAFYHFINRYIYLHQTAEIDSASGYNKYEYRQTNAILNGYEFAIEAGLTDRLILHGSMDVVIGRNKTTDNWLPLLPPIRFILGSRWNLPNLLFVIDPYISLQSKFVMAQHRVDILESPTPGYALFDIGFGGAVPFFSNEITLYGSIENIFNKSYHDHLNLYKDYFLNPGINFILRLSVPFTLIRSEDNGQE
ncbi:MAG: TonB-dependent receptor [Ignavibacteriales bacterium]|nr:TonB-dependent receptor [Ignavibacteriales bacterium]